MFFIDFGNVEDIAIDELIVITRKGLIALGDAAISLTKVSKFAHLSGFLTVSSEKVLEVWFSCPSFIAKHLFVVLCSSFKNFIV